MASLRETLAALIETGEGYAIDAPAEWAQGRTLFGGMTATLAYAAIGRAFPDLPPLRSAQFTFSGPAEGRLCFRPVLLRRGRSTAIVALDCLNGEGVAARASFAYGADRDSKIIHDRVVRPDVPAPEHCAAFHKTTKPLPGFLGRFDYRLAAGSRLFEPDNAPRFALWIRLREEDGVDPATMLLAMADALPCAAMANFPKPAPVSTLSWQVDLHQPLGDHSGWHLVSTESEAARDGYSLQAMRVHAADGRPLLTGRQVVAIFA